MQRDYVEQLDQRMPLFLGWHRGTDRHIWVYFAGVFLPGVKPCIYDVLRDVRN